MTTRRRMRQLLWPLGLCVLGLPGSAQAHEGYDVTTPGKPGSGGAVPLLTGTGGLAAGSNNTLELRQALPHSTGTWVLGLGELAAPFKGGVLGPTVDLLLVLPTDAAGRTSVPFVMPGNSVTAGRLWVQAWISDPGASANLSASNTLGLTIQPSPGALPLFAGPAFPSSVYSTPRALVAADLDGDGTLDVATASWSQHEIAVQPGQGDGRLGLGASYPSGGLRPVVLAAADLDGDGDLDLASLNSWSDDVSILAGAGDGSFGLPTTVPTGFARDMAAGDLDGDGDVDLLAGLDANDLATLLNDGAGGFSAGPLSDGGAAIRCLALADLDEDGHLDAIVGNAIATPVISIVPGLGDGSFGPKSNLPSGATGPTDLTVADLQGDGHLDVLVSHASGFVGVLLGAGDGSLAPAQSYATGAAADSLVVADFTADGVPDVATANPTAFTISLRRGLGDGGLGALITLPAEAPSRLAAGDLDGDDLAELIVSAQVGVEVLFAGTGAPFENPEGATLFANLDALVDVDKDGVLDLIGLGSGINSNSVMVALGTGDGTFSPAQSSRINPHASIARFVDLDGDGFVDLVTGHAAGQVDVSHGLGDGSFAPAQSFAGPPAPDDLSVGDLDGDGIPDLVVTSLADSVSVLLGLGAGQFAAPISQSVGHDVFEQELADLNGDGLLDLVSSGSPVAELRVLLGLGNGSFGPPQATALAFPAYDLEVGDLNSDGHPDVSLAAAAEVIQILWGAGDGSFSGQATLQAPWMHDLTISDLNGDGLPDLAGASDHLGVAVMLGLGDGAFVAPQWFQADWNGRQIFVGDVDQDGDPDLVARLLSQQVGVLLSRLN